MNNLFNLISNDSVTNTTNQIVFEFSAKFKIFFIISIVIFLFILTAILFFYILKRNNESLGVILGFLIGLFGFFGLFVAKEKEERKNFFSGWIIGFVIEILLCIVNMLVLVFMF